MYYTKKKLKFNVNCVYNITIIQTNEQDIQNEVRYGNLQSAL